MFFKSDFVHEYNLNDITYKEFYSEELFDEIEKYIEKDKQSYKVVSIGIHPSIADIMVYTLDGYLTNYDLDYKHQFREIISPELKKMKTYFHILINR